jgi:hypothetical protein
MTGLVSVLHCYEFSYCYEFFYCYEAMIVRV